MKICCAGYAGVSDYILRTCFEKSNELVIADKPSVGDLSWAQIIVSDYEIEDMPAEYYLREHLKNTYWVIYTQQVDEAKMDRAYRAGASMVFAKSGHHEIQGFLKNKLGGGTIKSCLGLTDREELLYGMFQQEKSNELGREMIGTILWGNNYSPDNVRKVIGRLNKKLAKAGEKIKPDRAKRMWYLDEL